MIRQLKNYILCCLTLVLGSVALCNANDQTIDLSRLKGKVDLSQQKSVAVTSGSNYFIATSLGEVDIDSCKFLVISALAPIAQMMLDKVSNEEFEFNNEKLLIVEFKDILAKIEEGM